jgi:biopolymer transport protein ExbB
MKKLFAIIAVFALLFLSANINIIAQSEMNTQETDQAQEMVVDSTAVASDSLSEEVVTEEAPAEEIPDDTPVDEPKSLHQQLKQKFIEGGATFMSFVLISLILGLALAIERIIYLNLATTNTDKLLKSVEDAMADGGVEAAKEVCRNTRGPVASIFYQGLDRADEGIDVVEKSVISYGSVQMGLLEKGISWISLFIAIAPMLGFMGTVIGMIAAFDAIEIAGEISPSLVAGGIKVALITTVSGLIVAIILQIFYNYIISKIDSIVNRMEDASISLVDILVKYKAQK